MNDKIQFDLFKKLLILMLTAFVVSSCSMLDFAHTRTEQETFTITERDTVETTYQKNAPESQDNGIVSPSPRVIQKERYVTQRDSVVERYYPDFIRLGVFESVGLITGADKGYGSGLFGLHLPIEAVDIDFDGLDDAIITGGLYRWGIMEYRLRWFQDSPNWTIGTSIYERILNDPSDGGSFSSILPIYIRKRFYFREDIPYLSLVLSGGLGLLPSQYGNLSASLDLGSLAGFNLRLYGGAAFGQQSIEEIIPEDGSERTNFIPYAGLGFSFLDFVNLEEETYKEWQYHEHSGHQIEFFRFGLLSNLSNSTIDVQVGNQGQQQDLEENRGGIIDGAYAQLLSGDVALPIFDNNFYVGTSFLDFWYFSNLNISLGVMPIRLGYQRQLLKDELFINPFIQYTYYPTETINIGLSADLELSKYYNVSFLAGYASGNTGALSEFANYDFGEDAFGDVQAELDFNVFYIGLSLGFGSEIFAPEELRYNKD
ncbi:MAG: hypothetical protein Kapaf2KO_21240 [Candidatus Kapaibacteriales bacterium]